jgi:soluble cytochrome b562
MIEEAAQKMAIILRGEIPEQLDINKARNDGERKLVESLNGLILFLGEIHQYVYPLSKGKLQDIGSQRNNYLASPFKELHSRLLHLTWQAEQVAKGDYTQRVDFMGDFSSAFNSMVISLDKKEKALQNLIKKEKLDASKATMRTVHDIVNNFLQNIQLFKMEAESSGALDESSLQLVDELIMDTVEKLRHLGDVDELREKIIGGGIVVVDYERNATETTSPEQKPTADADKPHR